MIEYIVRPSRAGLVALALLAASLSATGVAYADDQSKVQFEIQVLTSNHQNVGDSPLKR